MSIVNLRFLADTSQLDRARDTLNDVRDHGGSAGGAIDMVAEAFALLKNPVAAAVVVIGAAVAGMALLGAQAIQTADDMQDLVNAMGTTSEEIQSMQFFAEKAGISFDELRSARERFAKGLANGDEETSKLGRALAYIGINASDAAFQSLSLSEKMAEAAKQADKYADTGDKAAAMQIIFGKNAQLTANAVLEAAEGQEKHTALLKEYGAYIDSNLTASSGELNDQLQVLKLIFTGLGNDVARMVLPTLNSFVGQLKASYENGGLVKIALEGLKLVFAALWVPIQGLVQLFILLDTGIQIVAKSLGAVGEMLVKLFNRDIEGVKNTFKGLASEVKAISDAGIDRARNVGTYVKKSDAPVTPENLGNADSRSINGGRFDAKAPKDPKEEKEKKEQLTSQQLANKAIGEYLEKQYLEIQNVGDLNAEQRTLNELNTSKYKEADEYYKKLAVQQAKELEYKKAHGEATKFVTQMEESLNKAILDHGTAEARKNMSAVARDRVEVLDMLFDQLVDQVNELDRTKPEGFTKIQEEIIKKYEKMTGEVNKYFKVIEENQSKWQTGFGDAMGSYEQSMGSTAEQMQNVFTNAFQGMEDALVNFAMTGKLNFKDLAVSIIADLVRIQAKAAVVGFLKMVGSAVMGSPGEGATETAGTVLFANGGVVGNNGLSMFANGVVSNPTYFGMANGGTGLMGEAGPEAIMPLSRGRDGKLGVVVNGGGGGGTIVQNVTVNVQGGKTNEETGSVVSKAVVEQMKAIANQQIAGAQRPGGINNPFATRAF